MHRHNRESNPEKFYHRKLMMCLTWRNADLDIIAGYPNYETRYRAKLEHIMELEENIANVLRHWTKHLKS